MNTTLKVECKIASGSFPLGVWYTVWTGEGTNDLSQGMCVAVISNPDAPVFHLWNQAI